MESVFLPAGTTGTFTVTVTATNINSDGVPGNASALDQDFALVAYNTLQHGAPRAHGRDGHGQRRQPHRPWRGRTTARTSYNVYRATTRGRPVHARGHARRHSPFADTAVSGGITYYYVVRGVQCAESANSNEVSVTATGSCTLPPTFAGVTNATQRGRGHLRHHRVLGRGHARSAAAR